MSKTDGDFLPVVLLGAGGHAKVVLSAAQRLGWRLLGVCDPVLAQTGVKVWRGLPVLGDDRFLETCTPGAVHLLNGIGMVPGNDVRRRIHERWVAAGFRFPALVDPTAFVDETASLADGVQVLARAAVQADVVIADGSIINTNAQVDHDGRIGPHAHLAPGTVLCGDVQVGARAFLGAGCVVMPQVTIGEGSIIAAGAVLPKSVQPDTQWAPHRRLPSGP